jgi:hypothetical protein
MCLHFQKCDHERLNEILKMGLIFLQKAKSIHNKWNWSCIYNILQISNEFTRFLGIEILAHLLGLKDMTKSKLKLIYQVDSLPHM